MRSKYLAGLIIVLLCGCAAESEKDMKFDLSSQAGKTYDIHIFRETGKKFLNHSGTDTLDMEMSMHVPDTSNRIVLTFLNISVRKPALRMGTTEIDVSSMLDSMFTAAKGLSVKAQIDGKGITQKIDGADEMFNTIAQRLNKKTSEVKPWLADHISEDAIKDNLNRIFSSVACKKVKPGEKWGSDVVLATKAPVNINSLYTLANLHADSALVDIHSTILAGTAGNFYLNGEQNGSVVLNYSTGIPYRYETRSQTITKTVQYDVVETERFLATSRIKQ